METNNSINNGNYSNKKFKFCYVMRGLPGSGKTTVARELARDNGVIFNLDKDILIKNKRVSPVKEIGVVNVEEESKTHD